MLSGIRCMKKTELSLSEIRNISLMLLDEVHCFCVNNNLRYTLFHGSLLGAIRHKGFIPWDDDIDIAMPRTDYEIFIDKFISTKCKVVSYKKDIRYYLPWAKVCDLNTIKEENIKDQNGLIMGVNIDVYPVDTISNEKQIASIIKKRNRYEKYREYALCEFNNPLKKAFSLFFRGKANYFSKLIDKCNQQYSKDQPKYFITTEVYNVKPTFFSLNMFDNLILAEFENRKYFISDNYDELLSKRLGNYLELPPVEERKRHHTYIAYKYVDE